MNELQKLMFSIQRMGEEPQPGDAPVPDLLLYAPCPVKLAVKDRVEAVAATYAARGEELRIHIPMGCTSVDPYDPVYKSAQAESLPGIIASIGYGDFWRREFVERFVDRDVFGAVLPPQVNPMYERAGLIDPAGHYTIYGVTPYVFLADTRLLDGLPLPRTWADVLDPKYRGRLVMCGDGDDMADAVILNIHKEFGTDGLRALAANAKTLMHSSRMAKIAGSTEKDTGAIFIIPAFFAESAKHPAHVRTIWPEDGAAASPLYFLARRSESERLSGLLEFFTSGFAGIDSAAWFAPVDGSRTYPLPPEASLKWVGWDFIRSNDIHSLRDRLYHEFRAMLEATR